MAARTWTWAALLSAAGGGLGRAKQANVAKDAVWHSGNIHEWSGHSSGGTGGRSVSHGNSRREAGGRQAAVGQQRRSVNGPLAWQDAVSKGSRLLSTPPVV